ncbi:MAG: glycosyltransferase family 2 protein [Dysgonamonadaceae bacterium]|nr:glycosyltransferase family 2 protein [Dysgonamonadaceae bacterium]
MILNYPKISVITICYNQEDVIHRAIDSVICQKDYLHELIISDDCSKDETWKIVKDYQRKYPQYVKAYRNEKNMGVYENLQNTYNKVSGEIIFFLSGDDEIGLELLEKTCKTVASKNLDYLNDRFCVITDFKVVLPNKTEKHIKSNALIEKYDPFSLKFRGIIYNRALGESLTTFNDRRNTSLRRKEGAVISSSLQEGFTDNIPYVNTESFFYIPYVGNIYYAGIGISTKFKKNRREYLEGIIEYCETIPDYFKNLNKYDCNWLNFHKTKTQFLLKPTFYGYWIYFLKLFVLAKDPLRKFFLSREIKSFVKGTKLFFHQ